MDSPVSPNQPRKKRRTDGQERKKTSTPSEFVPLVSPNLVQKSSKDPNRGMYPRSAEKSKIKRRGVSYPTFTKASKLLKKSPDLKKNDEKSHDYDTSSESAAEKSPKIPKVQKFLQHRRRIAVMRPCDSCKKVFHKKKVPSKLNKLPITNLTNKINKYFSPLPKRNKPSTSKDSGTKAAEISNDSQIIDAFKKKAISDSVKHVNDNFFEKLSKSFGLLEDDSKEERINYFARLPHHVMETILCQVPFLDLIQYRLVCSTWNDVISDDQFMSWKKLYYGLRKGKEDSIDYMDALCTTYELALVEDCFVVLIKFMSNGFGRKPSSDMCDLLSKNSKAVEAELVLVERFPEVLTKDSKAWCIFATAMLLSETVLDVYNLYLSVDKLNSDISLHDVTNAMYCVATFLLHFRSNFRINMGLHYRVYSALYWIENNLPSVEQNKPSIAKVAKTLPGQHSFHIYCGPTEPNLTYEQLRIINHRFAPNQIIKIVALAGTGKTTTLVHLTRLYPQVKFVNVMFNKALSDASKAKFPNNVVCKTAHALAFQVFGHRLKYKLSEKIRPHDIVTELKCNEGSSLQMHSYAKHVLSTIQSFYSSVDTHISRRHVPIADSSQRITETDRSKILNDALQIWQKMIDKDNKNLKITHDVYLKLYQLSKPKFSEFQCVMVDEAQDCNPAMLDILLSQNLPIILAGDPNQQIYAFRGAENALQSIEATHTYHLTKSFRFGPEISYIAACCLEVLKGDVTQTIVGSDKTSSIDGRVEGRYAIISRSNLALINEAIRVCCRKDLRSHEPSMIWGSFAGGINSYGLDQMLDIYKLALFESCPDKLDLIISDKFISKFKSFKELTNYARSAEDSELIARIDLVNQHGSQIKSYVKTIKEVCKYPLSQANFIFSTVHKAKGLEFDTVCLTEDFPIVPQFENTLRWHLEGEFRGGSNDPSSSEETNILYVAVTRATTCLLLPDKLIRVLLTTQEKFEYPMLTNKILKDRTHFQCINCGEIVNPHTTLILVRRAIMTSSGRTIPGGELCVKCGSEPTVRPRVQMEPVVMYLDPTPDYAHRSMSCLVGPLPSDPPIVRDTFGAFNDMDVVYIINVNL